MLTLSSAIEIFGLQNEFTETEFSKACSKLLSKYHSDKNGGENSDEYTEANTCKDIINSTFFFKFSENSNTATKINELNDFILKLIEVNYTAEEENKYKLIQKKTTGFEFFSNNFVPLLEHLYESFLQALKANPHAF